VIAFLSGALGAIAVLFLLALVAFGRFHRRRRRWLAGRGRGRLGFLLARLDARPEQRAVLSEEADALHEAFAALRTDARALRAELADLIVASELDASRVRAALDGPFARLEAARARAEAALARAHATLDPAQRAVLADLVRCGPRRVHA
jgi:Spy/CpxP family protein refolding chaperone